MVNNSKVTICGAGGLGVASANAIAGVADAEVVLVDPEPGLARAAAADVALAVSLAGREGRVRGGAGYELAAGSRACVLACGHPPPPGVKRGESDRSNLRAVAEASTAVARHCPNAALVVAVEPNEESCHVALEATEFPRARVLGVGGVTASAALRLSIAAQTGALEADVAATVLGARGHDCVPLLELATVAGAPLHSLLPWDRFEAIERDARDADRAEARAALPLATAAAVSAIVEALLTGSGRVLACSAYCRGEYGIDNTFVAVPCRLGAGGIAEIVELPLAEQRLGALRAAADSVRNSLTALR